MIAATTSRTGEILIANQILSQEEMQRVLALQQSEGGRTVDCALRLFPAKGEDILKALAERHRIGFRRTLPVEISFFFASRIPFQFLKKYGLVPVVSNTEKFIACADPLQLQAVDDVRNLLNMEEAPLVLCPHAEIVNAIQLAYASDRSDADAEQVIETIAPVESSLWLEGLGENDDLLDDSSDAPIIRLVNLILTKAVQSGASDIHFEPFQKKLKIRQRIDGRLYDLSSPPAHIQAALVSRIKIMANLDIAEKRLPQDGRIEIRIGDKQVDIRVSTLPTSFGERVVMRLLHKTSVLKKLTDLGMDERQLGAFKRIISSPHGIFLVTGPTGSGKTTTLYAALSTLKQNDINIITIEDPIEYRIEGISQMQVNPKIDLTFANGLRTLVRQDPDVILVGEIRDAETASIAVQSALTGHLVFSTLHTNDSASAVTRLHNMGIEPFLITSSVIGVLAQRLVRLLCPSCRQPAANTPEILEHLGCKNRDPSTVMLFEPTGCPTCFHTGYHGRAGIFELLVMNDAIRAIILNTTDSGTIKQKAIENGMQALYTCGLEMVLAGKTSAEELVRVSQQ